MESKQSASSYVKEIKRRTRRTFSTEEKIKIVLEGIRGEDSVAVSGKKDGTWFPAPIQPILKMGKLNPSAK